MLMCSNLNGTFYGVDGVAVSSTTLRRGGETSVNCTKSCYSSIIEHRNKQIFKHYSVAWKTDVSEKYVKMIDSELTKKN